MKTKPTYLPSCPVCLNFPAERNDPQMQFTPDQSLDEWEIEAEFGDWTPSRIYLFRSEVSL